MADFSAIEKQFGISFPDYFARELLALAPLADDGLVNVDGTRIVVQPFGRLLLRNIAMVFDAYLRPQGDSPGSEQRFSRVI